MQALAIADGQCENPLVRDQIENVAGGIENGGAVTAIGQVLFDGGAQLRCDPAVNVIRNFLPNVFAVQHHDPPALRLNIPSSPPRFMFNRGASTFCSMSRARRTRVFTTPSLTPSMATVSAILKSCTSLSTRTSR